MPHTDSISRRNALKLMFGGLSVAMAGLGLSPRSTWADTAQDVAKTEADLAAAQSELDSVQAQLDQIAKDYSALAAEHAKTLDEVESTQGKIDKTQAQIDKTQADLEEKQGLLSKRMSSAYKTGGNDMLSILLNSTSLEELSSSIYYLDKVSERDRSMIDEVKGLKERLSGEKAQLEGQKAELEKLSRAQQDQMGAMQAKQEEVQKILSGLSQQMKDLMAQRDSALQAQAEEKRRQEEAAAAAAAAANTGAGGGPGVSGNLSGGGAGSGSQQAVINACHAVGSPGPGWCAMWVSQVFQAAGFGYPGGNACDMYNAWCTSSNLSNLQPGMIIAVSSYPYSAAGQIYGHVGIYVGGGTVMDNVGFIRSSSVSSWISYYGGTVTPRWGWCMGVPLG